MEERTGTFYSWITQNWVTLLFDKLNPHNSEEQSYILPNSYVYQSTVPAVSFKKNPLRKNVAPVSIPTHRTSVESMFLQRCVLLHSVAR